MPTAQALVEDREPDRRAALIDALHSSKDFRGQLRVVCAWWTAPGQQLVVGMLRRDIFESLIRFVQVCI